MRGGHSHSDCAVMSELPQYETLSMSAYLHCSNTCQVPEEPDQVLQFLSFFLGQTVWIKVHNIISQLPHGVQMFHECLPVDIQAEAPPAIWILQQPAEYVRRSNSSSLFLT